MTRPLILASGSPRRKELLAQLGVPFRVVISEAPETIDLDLTPEAQAIALAARKAEAVAAVHPGAIVLAADTLVVLDGDLLGKPVEDVDAARILRRLSGREHEVVTGVILLDVERGQSWQSAVTSRVGFRELSEDEISVYVATGEPRDKAGAYAVQGRGGDLIATLDGCYTNVVGLPLCEVATLLDRAGVSTSSGGTPCTRRDGTSCPRLV